MHPENIIRPNVNIYVVIPFLFCKEVIKRMPGIETFHDFQTEDIWTLIVNRKLQNLNTIAGNGTVASGTVIRQVLGRQAINTNPRTGLEIHAIGWYVSVAPQANAAIDTISNVKWNLDVTYDQPSPPAADTTTPASTTGNLGFRNLFVVIHGGNTQVQGSAVGVTFLNGVHQGFKVFAAPFRIVGTNLEVGLTVYKNDHGAYWDMGVTLLGKYVDLTDTEYVNLVALATGEAILPPSILG